MNSILERELEKKQFVDPEVLLWEIKPFVVGILQHSEIASELTAKEKKEYLEKYQAGWIGFMIKKTAGNVARVSVRCEEIEDADCIIKIECDGEIVYRLVQLKQVPPHRGKADIGIQDILEKVKNKYGHSHELIVGIWVNQDCSYNLRDLKFEDLDVERVYLYGDDVSGQFISMHGGLVKDWIAGVCWECRITHGVATPPTTLRFKTAVQESTASAKCDSLGQ